MLQFDDKALWESAASRQEKPSRCNWNGAASNKHVAYLGLCEGCADVDAGGTPDLHSLFEDGGLPAGHEAVPNEPCDGAPGGRASGGIFAAVELHAVVEVCAGSGIGRGEAEEELGVGGGEPSPCGSLRDAKPLDGGERAKGNDAERQPGRDRLNGIGGVEIVNREPENRCDLCRRVNATEDGIGLAHGAEDTDLAGDRRTEADGDWARVQVERDGFRPAQDRVIPEEPGGGSEGGMASEAELFLRGEDADPNSSVELLSGVVRGEDEGGFSEVGLACKGLHLVGGERARVGEDGEHVAFEWMFREDINEGVIELKV